MGAGVINSNLTQFTKSQDWHFRSVVLECEILQLAINKEQSEIQSDKPNVFARAKLRGLMDTLSEKVREGKILVRQRRNNKGRE